MMQAASDIFLGWIHIKQGMDGVARDFYGRQLKDWKGSAEIEQMIPEGMAAYGRLCGWTLARAHARSGDRIAIASYLGGGNAFDRAILEFSKAYADQNEPTTRRWPRRSSPAGSWRRPDSDDRPLGSATYSAADPQLHFDFVALWKLFAAVTTADTWLGI